MAAPQVATAPFNNGNKYKIFNASNPATPGLMVTYDPEPAGPHNFHRDNTYRFRKKEGLFVGYTGNAGGRRKPRRSKRSKRSARKSRRRY